MIDVPEISETTARLTALIHLTIPRSEIRAAMGPGIAELTAVVQAQGIGPVGSWFTHHLKVEPETFDFEICMAVSEPVVPVGRVVAGRMSVVKVARTVYHGDYQGLGAAWSEFKTWIAAHEHPEGPDFYEFYLVGPESSANPADWRTELSQPLLA
jgi:effector-binding domain-containing protein